MLDHVGATVSDLARSRAFYDAALAPLGIAVIMEVTPEQTGGSGHLGYGSGGRPYFWIGDAGPATGRLHVALAAPNRAAVDAFHAAAMAAGGRDNGPPRPSASLSPQLLWSLRARPGRPEYRSCLPRPGVSR